ncbi:crotonobetainyl-CoA:carnitine CoA-transferase CaiB-like acyl-CoA transferase [Ottowia thiooxydans]|uniref:Crotonobetainyl-CoA:carnitine CoA-transferase CaiB-like acyl-CoA transferase n=2 Tax=Ottowia thiooxydans TaxID=219182 RepID=A0ABV2Q4I0_9BURK
MMVAPTGPLAGVRVIDITAVMMGPWATQMLADLGADVIKVEPPKGDSTRRTGPAGEQLLGPLFLGANRNKRSIVLDLKAPEGVEALLRLVEGADVLTYNVRPAAMKRLGLTYERLAEVNPRLIYVGLFGFSQSGRYAAEPAFDDLIQSAMGLPNIVAAHTGQEPRYVPFNLADRSVGLYAFGVIASALYARTQTGQGQRIDVPMFETMVPAILGDHLYGKRFDPARGEAGYPRLLSRARKPFRTRDAYVCCLIYHEHHWTAFLEVIGKSEMMKTDPRLASIATRMENIDSLNEFVAGELAQKTTAEWQALLKAADIPVFPVHTFDSLLEDPHLRDIEFFRTENHPTVGPVFETAVPSEWHGTPPGGYMPAPSLGQHSAELLKGVGYSEAEVASLLARGISSGAA